MITNLSVGCLMRCGACRYPENLFALLLFGPPFQPPPRYTNENGYHSILICIPASIDWVGEEFEGISGSNLVPTAPLNTSFRLIFSPPPFFSSKLPSWGFGTLPPSYPYLSILFSFLFFSFLFLGISPLASSVRPFASGMFGKRGGCNGGSFGFFSPSIYSAPTPPLESSPIYFFIFLSFYFIFYFSFFPISFGFLFSFSLSLFFFLFFSFFFLFFFFPLLFPFDFFSFLLSFR